MNACLKKLGSLSHPSTFSLSLSKELLKLYYLPTPDTNSVLQRSLQALQRCPYMSPCNTINSLYLNMVIFKPALESEQRSNFKFS